MRRFCSLRCLHALARSVLIFVLLAASAGAQQPSPQVAQGLGWLQAQILSDGSLIAEGTSLATPFQARTETLLTLRTLASVQGTWVDGLPALAEPTTEYTSRQIIAHVAAGRDATALVSTLLSWQNADGGFGGAAGYGSEPLDSAWAVLALDRAGYGSSAAAQGARSYLIAQRQGDGGIGTDDTKLRLEISALTVLALRASADLAAVTAADAAGVWTKSAMSANGAWVDDTYLTALAWLAIGPVTVDTATRDAVTSYLLGKQSPDGSWSGDPFATAIVLRALSDVASPSSLVASLSGRIVEGGTGLPLAGASIVVQSAAGQQASASTGADGRYSIGNLGAGTYTLSASKAGYASVSANVPLGAGQQRVIADIALAVAPSTGVVRGNAKAASNSAPLAGVTVTVAGTPSRSAVTDANGFYEIVGVPAGSIQVSASKTGYIDVTGTGTLASGGVIVFSPSLYATGSSVPTQATVSGQVVAAGTNAPLSGVAVKSNGTTRATTAADGRFGFNTAAGSYTIEYALAGYASAFQSIVVSAGTVLDAGVIALNAVRTTSRMSGVISKAGGGALEGAAIAVDGGPSATTGPTGAYVLDNLAGTTFALTISAPGYIAQAYTLQLSTPGDVVQNFTLVPLVQGNLQFSALTLTPASVAANASVDATAQLTNNSGAGVAVVIVLQVRDASDALVSTGTPVDALGLGLGVLQLADAEAVAVSARWNSAQFEPGTYTVVMRAVAAGSISRADPEGRVLGETRGLLTITQDSHIDGSVTADPPVQRAGSTTPVKLSAAVQNSGNTMLAAPAFTLTIVNSQTSAQAYSQTVASSDLPVGGVALLTFPDWTPSVAANYTLTVTSTGIAGTITGSAYVGDSASATYTVDKPLVSPGTQTVKGTITVTGQDVVGGVISDPLAPLIKTAIQKAVTFNDAAATTWIETNRCSSCHIGNQALVGGELTRRVASDFNAFQRNVILNNVASNQASSGGLTEGYPGFPTTLGSMSLWAMTAYHNLDVYKTVLKRAADWAFGLQASAGHWTIDYSAGWFDSNLTATTVNLDSLAKVYKLLVNAVTVPTYTVPAFMPTFTAASRGPLSRDSAGNIYFAQISSGNMHRLRPDGTVLATWRSLNDPLHAVELNDGQVWMTSAGGLHRLNADGTYVKLNSETMTWLAVAPDGTVYGTRWQDRTIYKLDSTGHATAWLTSSSFTWPTLPVFDADGSMLVPDYSTLRVMRVRPDKSLSVAVEMVEGYPNPNANPIYLLKDGDHWLLSTTNGIFRHTAEWEGQRLTFTRADGMVQLNDGSIVYASQSVGGMKQLTPGTTPVGSSLANYATGVNRATNFLQGTTLGVTDTLHLAHQLWGLGAAYSFYLQSDPSRAATIQTKMNTLATQLRTNQNTDGGWGRSRGNLSDSLVTAQVGFALDYTNPSPSDPAIRKAVTWLLSRQQADGSWISENGIFSTRESATTWVSIWLPVILDRLGGIDTKVTATFAPNVTMSAPTIAPNTVQTLPTGEQRYTWNLPSVTNAGREIDFNLTLADMQLNEVRPASTEAYLSFANTFTGETQTAAFGIPTVTASDFMSLTVATDRVSYPANSTVAITGVVTNTGVGAQAGTVTYDIVDAGDALVAHAPTGSFASLAPNSSANVPSSWNTGTSAAGSYSVVATLYDSAARKVSTARAGFTIIAGTDPGAPTLASSVTTDRPTYAAYDRVSINGRVQSLAPNTTFTDLTVTETVKNATGATVFTGSQPLAQLLPDAIRDLTFPQTLNNAAPGVYTVTQQVSDASGTVLDTKSTQYTVLSSATTGAGLTGTIAAAPKAAAVGDQITFSGKATNGGNASLAGLPLTVVVMQPDTQTVAAQFPYSANIAQTDSYAIAQGWSSASAAPGTYVVALLATVGGQTITLAQDTFTLSIATLLDITQSFQRDSRVLVLVACDNSQNNGQVPDCVGQRASFVDAYLTSLGVEHKIVTDTTSFATELRCGRYNTYWLSGSADKLDADLAGEVVEAVYHGDGLLIDGVHDQRNHLLEPLLGIDYRGKQPASASPGVTLTGSFLQPGHFTTSGDNQSARLTTGTLQGSFDNGDPALVTLQYGRGQSLLFAFDLVATLQAQPASPLLQGMVNRSIGYVMPSLPQTFDGGAFVPVATTITNEGVATDVEVIMTVPSGVIIVDEVPASTEQTATQVTWRFNLPAGGSKDLELDLRAPTVSGHYSVQTQVNAVRGGVSTPYQSLSLDLAVTAADQASPATIASLQGLTLSQQQQKNARDRAVGDLQAAQNDLNQGRALSAIEDYLAAVRELEAITAVSTVSIRLAIDGLLKEAERAWCLVNGGSISAASFGMCACFR